MRTMSQQRPTPEKPEDAIRAEMGLPPRPPISLTAVLYGVIIVWLVIVVVALFIASAQTGSYPTQYITK